MNVSGRGCSISGLQWGRGHVTAERTPRVVIHPLGYEVCRSQANQLKAFVEQVLGDFGGFPPETCATH